MVGTVAERPKPSPSTPTRRTRRVELTEENVQRIFGIGMHDLFKRLAEKFGYQIEE